ncbi:hypothetical protein [Pseudomonas sp. FEN]|nr:hypothetical protein [Pseudomonas sp. FEN]
MQSGLTPQRHEGVSPGNNDFILKHDTEMSLIGQFAL